MLLVSRVWEQAVIGLSTLVLARQLGVLRFAPVSTLFVINSFAVTVSDFGLGLAVLRLPPRATIRLAVLRRARLANSAIAATGLATGYAVGGSAGRIIAASGLIWATSAEAYVRKAGAIRDNHAGQAALAEVVGTTILLTAAVVGAIRPSSAVAVVAAGFVLKHTAEAALVRHWRGAFATDEGASLRSDVGLLWGAQLLSFLAANVDYVTVGVLLSRPSFSVYVIGFRLANAVPAQISYVTGRISLVDFGRARDQAERQATYDRYVARLFGVGVAGAAVTLAVAPLLPVVLGSSWRPVSGVIAVLALGVPWRMVLSVASAMVLAGGQTKRSLRWEGTRLVLSTAVFAAAAAGGFPIFVVTVTLTWTAAALAYHTRGGIAVGVRPWPLLVPTAAVTAAIAIAGGTLVHAVH